MEFRILGPLEVRSDGRAIAVGGEKRRALLAMLVLQANQPVGAERLAQALWGEDAATDAVKTVRVHVSRIRAALEDPDALVTTPAGYRLRVRPGELDADRFEDLLERGRRALADGAPAHAAELLRTALGLWRGSALADVRYAAFAQTAIGRLEELRWDAIEARNDADLQLGRADAVLAELEPGADEAPLRERLVEQRMRALYEAGRHVEALAAYREAQQRLDDELGLQPGPALRELERAILVHDASLRREARDGPPPPATATVGPRARARGARGGDRRETAGHVDRARRGRQDTGGSGGRSRARREVPRRRPCRVPGESGGRRRRAQRARPRCAGRGAAGRARRGGACASPRRPRRTAGCRQRRARPRREPAARRARGRVSAAPRAGNEPRAAAAAGRAVRPGPAAHGVRCDHALRRPGSRPASGLRAQRRQCARGRGAVPPARRASAGRSSSRRGGWRCSSPSSSWRGSPTRCRCSRAARATPPRVSARSARRSSGASRCSSPKSSGLFRALAAFVGGAELDAAVAVTGGPVASARCAGREEPRSRPPGSA